MKIIILSCAESEFAEIVDYYNEQCSGLGYEFAAEVQRTFDRINYYPEAWALFSQRSRRCLVDRFPYAVLYQTRTDCILVGGIMHLKRNPSIWQDRADKAFNDTSSNI